MKKYFILLFLSSLLISCSKKDNYNPEIKEYVSFLETQNQSAKNYILDLFDSNDLVIICERYHNENTQYELITDIISDPRFVENVGNVFFETGMRSINPELNNFVHSENLSEKEVNRKLINLQRQSDYFPLWEYYNFYDQNKQLYTINQDLKDDEKINIYAVDVELNLDSLSVASIKEFWNGDIDNRDQLMAAYIIEKFEDIKHSNAKRKKALIIMNYRHAYNKNFITNDNNISNTGAFIFEKYPKKTANVLLNTVILQGGKWDAAFEVTEKDNIGFDFKNSPFGKDQFDIWSFTEHSYKYQDIFTGFAYYKSPKEYKLIEGYDGLIDSTFIETYKQRVKLWNQVTDSGYPLDDSIIYNDFNKKNVHKLDNIDSISSLIDKWIKE